MKLVLKINWSQTNRMALFKCRRRVEARKCSLIYKSAHISDENTRHENTWQTKRITLLVGQVLSRERSPATGRRHKLIRHAYGALWQPDSRYSPPRPPPRAALWGSEENHWWFNTLTTPEDVSLQRNNETFCHACHTLSHFAHCVNHHGTDRNQETSSGGTWRWRPVRHTTYMHTCYIYVLSFSMPADHWRRNAEGYKKGQRIPFPLRINKI